jgi:hypothetical protein
MVKREHVLAGVIIVLLILMLIYCDFTDRDSLKNSVWQNTSRIINGPCGPICSTMSILSLSYFIYKNTE